MSDQIPFPVHLFDRGAEFAVFERRLPHWSQAGAVCFITWRTHDSMPQHVIDTWCDDRKRWLGAKGIDPHDAHWQQALQALNRTVQQEFWQTFWNRWHDALDDCHGRCVLRDPALSAIVAKSLLHFEGDRYLMFDFVVMPNHVHVLAAFRDENSMLSQCESWKHFSATLINRRLGQKGRFWQQDGFDHLVRSEEQLEYLRHYIRLNPIRANLKPGESSHYSKPDVRLQE
jgi:REP element-mobilizing transposase RayT